MIGRREEKPDPACAPLSPRTRATLPRRESEERFRNAFAHASVGMAITSLAGRFLEVNQALCEITGYTPADLLATDLQAITHPEDLAPQAAAIRRMMAGESPGFVRQERFIRKDGAVRWVQSSVAFGRDAEGKPNNLLALIQDVTERKSVEAELRQKSELLQTIFDHIPVMISIADPGGRTAWVNREWERVIGWSLEEARELDVLAATFPDPAYREEVLRFICGPPSGWRDFETRVRDGRILVTAWANVLLSDGRIMGFGQDITERKRREQEHAAEAAENARLLAEVTAARERLEALSRRLVNLQEEERRTIARELHDEVGQILTGLRLMLETKDRGAPVDLVQVKDLVAQLLERVRDLSLNLRPPMLDDLGLVPALLWHFERYQAQTRIRVRFHHRGLPPRLAPEAEIAAFRIVQEALTNVARHAQVKEANVELWTAGSHLSLRVEDEGVGFDADKQAGTCCGLAGMRGRARLAGGSLILESRPGGGTRLVAKLPTAAPPTR